MIKGYSKALVFVVLGLFLFSFAASFVSAGPGMDTFTDGLESFFSGGLSSSKVIINSFFEEMGFGAFAVGGKDAFAQFLLMVITIMLVYSVLDFMGIFKDTEKGWISWVVSIAAGFLGFLYVDANTIRLLAEQYKIMAVALNVILPWAVIIAFIWRLQVKAFKGEGNINPAFVRVVSWVMGAGLIWYLFVKLITDPIFIGIVRAISWIVIVLLIAFLLFNRQIIMLYMKGKAQTATNKVISGASMFAKMKRNNKIAAIIAAYNNGGATSGDVGSALNTMKATKEERSRVRAATVKR